MHRILPFLALPIILATIIIALYTPNNNLKGNQFMGCRDTSSPLAFAEEYDPNATTGIFEGRLVNIPRINDSLASAVLGESVGDKRIEVDLANQRVYAYENGTKVFDFLISSGLNNWTRRGNFSIYRKVGAQRMRGPGYDLPNVPWVMYFDRGISFHGTYWHNDFGRPKSHGCVNMRIPDSEALYHWAPMGTPVRVY